MAPRRRVLGLTAAPGETIEAGLHDVEVYDEQEESTRSSIGPDS